MSTMQIIENAIDQSKAQDEIVTISTIDMRRAGVTLESVLSALFAECEGETKNGSIHEHWGEDVDGNEWRVHVEVGS